MKKVFVCLPFIVLLTAIFVIPVFAQEQENPYPFRGGLTYIRYRLDRDVLPLWSPDSIEGFLESDSETTTLTLENGEIDNIDAYFEIADLDFTLGDDMYDSQHNSADKDFYDPRAVSWNIGDIALILDYDKIHEGSMDDQHSGDEHLIRGRLNMPLGESGFSLGAYLAMYGADNSGAYETVNQHLNPQIVQTNIAEIPEVSGGIVQAAFVGDPAGYGEPMTVYVPASKLLSPGRAVVGAFNFSGDMKGVDVFTEVGFASTGEHTVSTMVDEMKMANFYALGGAKYTVGQVTLGIEAGFENGNEPVDDLTNTFSGFENDFEFDNIIEDDIPGDELHNKFYAKVSARMNPMEKMSVEGAFSYVKSVEDGGKVGPYVFEVNGTLYYSLADYIKYLVKAGVVSSEDSSIEDNQYKLLNKLEFRF